MAQKAEELGVVRTVSNWINGEIAESQSDRYGDVFDSATGEKCARVVMSTEADVDAAVAAARRHCLPGQKHRCCVVPG